MLATVLLAAHPKVLAPCRRDVTRHMPGWLLELRLRRMRRMVQAIAVRRLRSPAQSQALSSALQWAWQLATVEFTKDNLVASR